MAPCDGQGFPFIGRRKAAQIEIGATIQDRSRDADDSAKPHELLFIDFIPTQQIGVIAEIPQEPAEFPKGSRGAIEPAGEGMALLLFGFQNAKPKDVERSLGVPAVEGSIDSGQEDAFQNVVAVAAFAMESRE